MASLSHRRARSGMMLAVVLVFALIAAILLGALVSRLEVGRRAVRHRQKVPTQHYESLSALNQVLSRVNTGQPLEQAVQAVSDETGVELMAAGDSLLARNGHQYLQVRLVPASWNHVLFGQSLSLAGVRGGFDTEDPHRPTQGTPPQPVAGFLEHYQDQARSNGIYLASDPAASTFQPGGGNWIRELVGGDPTFLYLGGGEGEGLGWTPGSHRWTWDGQEWACTNGDELRRTGGGWVFDSTRSDARLPGTLLCEEANLRVEADLEVDQVIVWEGGLEVDRAHLIATPSAGDCLAVAALRGDSQDPVVNWNDDRQLRPGDVVLRSGADQLTVGDPLQADQAGAVIYAESRLVKRGQGLVLAGVGAGTSVEISGTPSEDLRWSRRVSLQPPPYLTGGQQVLSHPIEVKVR